LGRERDLPQDLTLIEITIPRMTGLAVAEFSRKGKPIIKVLALAAHSSNGGDPFLGHNLARAALAHLSTTRGKGERLTRLTPRERQVLKLITEGHTNKEIAHHLGIGVRTAETHRERLMRRLGIHSVAGLIKFAVSSGLVSLEDAEAQSHGS